MNLIKKLNPDTYAWKLFIEKMLVNIWNMTLLFEIPLPFIAKKGLVPIISLALRRSFKLCVVGACFQLLLELAVLFN